MSKPVVFDLDGVLFDCAYAFTSLGHDRFGTNVVGPGAQPSWDFDNVMSFEQQTILWDYIKDGVGWWQTLPLLVTHSDIQAMVSLEVPIVYMTSRIGKHPRRDSLEALEWSGLPCGEIIIEHDKAERIEAMGGCLAVIEDRPSTLESLRDARHDVYARDWPYNRHVQGVERVGSVTEFCERVKEKLRG